MAISRECETFIRFIETECESDPTSDKCLECKSKGITVYKGSMFISGRQVCYGDLFNAQEIEKIDDAIGAKLKKFTRSDFLRAITGMP